MKGKIRWYLRNNISHDHHPQAGDTADMLGSVWEFPRSRLRLQTVLGEGNFGKVWKAEADDICGYDGTILVAVKTVKVISVNILA